MNKIREHLFQIAFVLLMCSILPIGVSSINHNDLTSSPVIINQAADTSMPFVNNSNVVTDGQIGSSEYGQVYYNEFTDIYVHWEYNNQSMKIGLVSESTGWIAIGFEAQVAGTTNLMDQANILMGGVEDSNSQPYCYDLYGLPGTFQHDEDENQGGFNNIVSCDGTQNATHTTVEFTYQYDPIDSLDSIPELETTAGFFLAKQATSDDNTRIHSIYDANLLVFFKSNTMNVETQLDIDGPEKIDPTKPFSITVSLQDQFQSMVDNATISISYKTQFGNMFLVSGFTNAQGVLTLELSLKDYEISLDHFVGKMTIIAVSQEKIVKQGDAATSYLGSSDEITISVQGQELEEEPAFVIASRWGLVALFWLIGMIIWTTFGYTLYIILQIFLNRHEETPNNEKNPNEELPESNEEAQDLKQDPTDNSEDDNV